MITNASRNLKRTLYAGVVGGETVDLAGPHHKPISTQTAAFTIGGRNQEE
jgi:hypothetical protein